MRKQRYVSLRMSTDSATITWWTVIPSFGVCLVINLWLRFSPTRLWATIGLWIYKNNVDWQQKIIWNSSYSLVRWTPPLNPVSKTPSPLPPARTWALTTYSPAPIFKYLKWLCKLERVIRIFTKFRNFVHILNLFGNNKFLDWNLVLL